MEKKSRMSLFGISRAMEEHEHENEKKNGKPLIPVRKDLSEVESRKLERTRRYVETLTLRKGRSSSDPPSLLESISTSSMDSNPPVTNAVTTSSSSTSKNVKHLDVTAHSNVVLPSFYSSSNL